MSHDEETPEMGYDTLALAQSLIRTIGGLEAKDGYDALRQLAPMLSCWQYGHPNQPKHFLSRFKSRPWRCWRCGTWWVTRMVHDPNKGWHYFLWTRVEKGE